MFALRTFRECPCLNHLLDWQQQQQKQFFSNLLSSYFLKALLLAVPHVRPTMDTHRLKFNNYLLKSRGISPDT